MGDPWGYFPCFQIFFFSREKEATVLGGVLFMALVEVVHDVVQLWDESCCSLLLNTILALQ